MYCGQAVGWIKMKLGMQVGLSPRHIVLSGDLAPPLPKQQSPRFSAHVCCDQMAGWIKMLLGMVGLGPCTRFCVRWRPSSPPQFSAYVHCGQTAGWIKTTLGTKMGLGPGHIVLDGDTALLHKKGLSPRPNFRSISVVAKRLQGPRCHSVRR